MKYRVLGKTGLSVSVVGFGTWQFGGEWGRSYRPDQVEELLSHAKGRGINFIDTAECYGDGLSESLVGQALRGRRADWIIATKFGHKYNGLFDRTPRWKAADMVQQLDRSLENLQTDYIDLYQLHSPKDDFFDDDELWTALGDQVKAGKVRHLGISVSPNDNLRQTEAATRLGAKTMQVLYNRLDRAPERRVLPSCSEQGLGVLRARAACERISERAIRAGQDAFFFAGRGARPKLQRRGSRAHGRRGRQDQGNRGAGRRRHRHLVPRVLPAPPCRHRGHPGHDEHRPDRLERARGRSGLGVLHRAL